MSRDVWPFFRAKSTSYEFAPWQLSGTDGALLPEYLEGWDPATDVAIERVVRCDLATIRRDTALGVEVPLLLSVSSVNEQSFMTESLYRAPLEDAQELLVELPAARLGGSITLKCAIVVGSTDISRPLGCARWAGSVLASHEQRLVLEGSGPMFPLAEVDFAASIYAPEASWALQFPEDLSLPVLGSVLLLVNSRDKELVNALSARKPDIRQTSLLQTLEGQVGSFLVAQAVERQAEIESEQWPDQSSGALLVRYLAIATKHGVHRYVSAGDRTAISAALEGAARAEGFGRRFE